MSKPTAEEIKQAVREKYSAQAREQLARIELTDATDACCGAPADQETSSWADQLYSQEELRSLPADAQALSLGCGNPTAIAELRPGERVLDLGSGSGLDCFLAAQRVGTQGRVVGVDMSEEMLELARRNLAKVGMPNVTFERGELEALPFADASFDVIISNCVINLSPDKDAVFREAWRVLAPGGRFRVADIVWTRTPSPEEQHDLERWAGCIAGALEIEDYRARLQAAGFEDVRVELAGEPSEQGFASAYISARKPAT